MKTLRFLSIVVAMMCCLGANAQTDYYSYDDDPSFAGSCTSVMVGKKASTDGSVMTAHACDSYYRTYVTMEPRKHFEPGQKEDVYYYAFRREEPWDNRIATVTGSIVPPKQDTYRFLNTAYPCMNEKQVVIGETTFDGRLELINRKGIFWIEELQRIGLEYASTAREAIEIMGRVAEEYGYCDWGECLTVADKNEVWQFEINGPGEGEPGAI
ncbi:MAG: C69 family dipeptidase [Bacteroidales bacterium]|nr:C69 family dipeptidase [Candidatus Cacconaster merdequi]